MPAQIPVQSAGLAEGGAWRKLGLGTPSALLGVTSGAVAFGCEKGEGDSLFRGTEEG